MNAPSPASPSSRRHFFGQVARGAAWLGTAALAAEAAFAAAKNPFAYDVNRYSRTDPKLIAWEETGRRVCGAREPRRLALAPDGSTYLAAGNQLVRWTATGERPSIDFGTTVRCVGVGPEGTVFVGLTNRILQLDANGRTQTEWPAPAPKTWYTGLAIAEREVFAADSGNRLVWRFDRAGKVLGRIGARDTARGVPGLVLPSPYLDVHLHADGLLRLNDPGRHRIELYTVDGQLELAWGEATAAIHGFSGCCNPIGLALLSDARVVTCEKGLPRVKVYSPTGQFESVVAGPESFPDNARVGANSSSGLRGGLDVAVDAQGRIHILDRATGEVRTLQPRKVV